MKYYKVKDWDDKYEIAQSRRYKSMSWVAIPNTHTTNGYAAVSQHPCAVELFCAFILIVEVASTLKKRGTLISAGGHAITAKNLAFITRYPEHIFQRAFDELIKPEIGWLELVEKH